MKIPALSGGSLAVMVYGSRARGSARPDSDLDILQVVNHQPYSYSVGHANVAQYKPATLLAMARGGSLFVHHLMVEGRVIDDSSGIISSCFAAYQPPENYNDMIEDIWQAGLALDPGYAGANVIGCIRLGVYLLRTLVYIRAAEAGLETFDLELILNTLEKPDIRSALEVRTRGVSEFKTADLETLWQQLAMELGRPLTNTHGSLAALAIWTANNAKVRPLMENLLFGRTSVDYSSLSLPPF